MKITVGRSGGKHTVLKERSGFGNDNEWDIMDCFLVLASLTHKRMNEHFNYSHIPHECILECITEITYV